MKDGAKYTFDASKLDQVFWSYFPKGFMLSGEQTQEVPFIRQDRLYIPREHGDFVLVKYELDVDPASRKSIDELFEGDL